MKLEQTHIQYHPEYDTVFVTFLPDKVGGKFHNNGRAVEREWEFFFAVAGWARKAIVVPRAVRAFRRWFHIQPKHIKATRKWVHPDTGMEITVTVKERVA